MQIRHARPDDLDALLDVWERAVRATHDFLAESDIQFYRPLVRDALAADVLDVWVLAADADVPVGFLGLDGGKIEAIFVAPELRRTGAGRRLVAHAQALHPGELTLDVNEQNAAARAFYEALGFVVEARSPVDGTGRPFPLLRMRRPAPVEAR